MDHVQRTRRLQPLHHPAEKGILSLGIAEVLLRQGVRHGEVLERAGDGKPFEPPALQEAGHRPLKVPAGPEADAAHAGVDLQMTFHRHSGGLRRPGQSPGIFQAVNRLGDSLLRQRPGARRAGHAQNQNGPVHAAAAQVPGLRQRADGKPRRSRLRQSPGGHAVPVAVSVGLYHGADRGGGRLFLNQAEVADQGVQVDLRPAVGVKGCCHRGSSSLLGYAEYLTPFPPGRQRRSLLSNRRFVRLKACLQSSRPR